MHPCPWQIWLFLDLLVNGKAEEYEQHWAHKIVEKYFILFFQGYIFNDTKNGDI
jgi:hypothetical protein